MILVFVETNYKNLDLVNYMVQYIKSIYHFYIQYEKNGTMPIESILLIDLAFYKTIFQQ